LREVAILDLLYQSSNHEGQLYVIKLIDKFLTKIRGESFYCSVIEYAKGGDLHDRIFSKVQQGYRLSFSTIHRYFVMVAKGLSFIHQNGVSHLDISMDNLVITSTDEIRICDFGQAEKERHVKSSEVRKGKAKYMSPEVYSLMEYDGFKADVWSLGVILWVMVTGGLLYNFATSSDKRFQCLQRGKKGIKFLLQIDEVHDVPPSLILLLSMMLEVDAKKRCLIEDVLAHPWVKMTPLVHSQNPIQSSVLMDTKTTSSVAIPSSPSYSTLSSVVISASPSSSTRSITILLSEDTAPSSPASSPYSSPSSSFLLEKTTTPNPVTEKKPPTSTVSTFWKNCCLLCC